MSSDEKDRLLHELREYYGSDLRERESLGKTISWLEQTDVLTYPQNLTGHLTADAWLLSPDLTHVLLTLHHKYQRWIQVGGHVDEGETTRQAALREAREESGIIPMTPLSPDIFDLDVHLVDAYKGEEHYHYDIRFLVRADSWDFQMSDESDDLRWFTPEEVLHLDDQVHWSNWTLGRMVDKWQRFAR